MRTDISSDTLSGLFLYRFTISPSATERMNPRWRLGLAKTRVPPSPKINVYIGSLVAVTRSAVWAADCVSDTGAGGETTAVSRAASPRQWYLARMVPTT